MTLHVSVAKIGGWSRWISSVWRFIREGVVGSLGTLKILFFWICTRSLLKGLVLWKNARDSESSWWQGGSEVSELPLHPVAQLGVLSSRYPASAKRYFIISYFRVLSHAHHPTDQNVPNLHENQKSAGTAITLLQCTLLGYHLHYLSCLYWIALFSACAIHWHLEALPASPLLAAAIKHDVWGVCLIRGSLRLSARSFLRWRHWIWCLPLTMAVSCSVAGLSQGLGNNMLALLRSGLQFKKSVYREMQTTAHIPR